jgi:WD40 repeat protein
MQFSALFACTKDGLRCLALERDGALGIHDAASRSFVPLQGGSASDISCVDFSEDGRRVAVVYGENAEIRIHDAVDGRLLHRLPPIGAPVVEVALQPGGEAILLRTTTREVRLIDERRRVDLRVFEPTTEPGVETGHIRFTPDGRTFLVHRTEYRGPDHIEIRSTQDGRRLGETPARYKARSGGWAIRSGPNPELIYGLGPHAWRWRWSRTVTPAPEDLLKAHGDETWTVAYSPDGSLLATTSNNDYERTTIRLRTPEGRVLREWRDDDGTVADLAFAPDSSWIATAHLSNARALRIRPIRGEGEVASVELPDGEWARAVDVDPNRPIVYAGGNLGTILAWNVERRRAEWRVMPPPERRVPKANERIHDLAIAPDGDRLAVVNDRGVVRILDTRHGSLLSSYEGRSPMLAVAYSPDGLTVAAADLEGWIHLLDAATGRLRQGVLGDDCDLRALAFSPDGRTLAAAGLGRVVRLWDPSTGEELLSLNGHEAQINSVAFSPDGETLASADHAGIVRFWRGPRREGR